MSFRFLTYSQIQSTEYIYVSEKLNFPISYFLSFLSFCCTSPLLLFSQHTDDIWCQPGWRGDLPVYRWEQRWLHTGQCPPHRALGWWPARWAHPCAGRGPLTHQHPGVLEEAQSKHAGHHRLCAPHPQDFRWVALKIEIVLCNRWHQNKSPDEKLMKIDGSDIDSEGPKSQKQCAPTAYMRITNGPFHQWLSRSSFMLHVVVLVIDCMCQNIPQGNYLFLQFESQTNILYTYMSLLQIMETMINALRF